MDLILIRRFNHKLCGYNSPIESIFNQANLTYHIRMSTHLYEKSVSKVGINSNIIKGECG